MVAIEVLNPVAQRLADFGTALQDRFPGTALVKVWGVMGNPEPTFTKVVRECDVVIGATGD